MHTRLATLYDQDVRDTRATKPAYSTEEESPADEDLDPLIWHADRRRQAAAPALRDTLVFVKRSSRCTANKPAGEEVDNLCLH